MGAVMGVPETEADKIDHMRRWAPAVLFTPILPCLYALVIIVTGEIIVNVVATECVKQLGIFVRGCVGISYLLLLTFSWSYLGFSVNITFKGKPLAVISPFTSLATLARCYLLIVIIATGWWGLGSYFIPYSVPCIQTAPKLYAYTLALVFSFWPLWLIGLIYLCIKERNDRKIRRAIYFKDQDEDDEDDDAGASRREGDLDAEEKILQARFAEFDEDGSGQIEASELGKLLAAMGIELSEQELESTMALLDDSGDGTISFSELLAWYRMSPKKRAKWMKRNKHRIKQGANSVRNKHRVKGGASVRGTGEEEEEEEDDNDEGGEEDEK